MEDNTTMTHIIARLMDIYMGQALFRDRIEDQDISDKITMAVKARFTYEG